MLDTSLVFWNVIKVLIYVGTLDCICNLEWSRQEKFLAAKNYKWLVDSEAAGETQSAEGLTWATILGDGHMVPYDKPLQVKEMIYRWLEGHAP
ncbi:hypothetical protein CF319_g7389 [Tilletia indica]|nr:hypothetical protein CF319_g7389 [Tilletia indica]